MFSNDDLGTLFGFLKSTSESNLKSMLVGGQMSEDHFKVLMKVMRSTNQTDFVSCFESGTFPKVKLSTPELQLREGFWKACTESFTRVGLLTHKKAA
jgi:hypothetical protein